MDVGIDFSPEDIERIAQSPGATLPDEPLLGLESVGVGASPYCQEEFVPCGGLLVGTWEMLDTCTKETRNPKALQIWGQTVMHLDTTACWDAVESVKSDWKGRLVFAAGAASDHRMRTDTVEMTLTRTCLNATFDVSIRADKMSSVCASLTDPMRSCISVAGACSCSSRRESELNSSRTYGVLVNSVVLGRDADQEFFEYCVKGDQMLWRAEATGRLLAMRRVEASVTETADPMFVR